jgi:RNA polymerase sigma-70 factor (ECF subfamily)
MDHVVDDAALADLLQAVAKGDRAAFEQLYRATSRRLFSFARMIVRRRDLAEDVLQEAFLRVWARAGTFDPARGSVMPWLTAIVRYIALNRLRAAGSDVPIDDHLDAPLPVPVRRADPVDLARCLDGLTAEQRRAVLLVHYYGYTHEELAQALGAPLGTVKSWVRRGGERLRACLER